MTTVKISGGDFMRKAVEAARPRVVAAFQRVVEESFEELMSTPSSRGYYRCEHGIPLNKICGRCAGLK
jgi:hypothetical protein